MGNAATGAIVAWGLALAACGDATGASIDGGEALHDASPAIGDASIVDAAMADASPDASPPADAADMGAPPTWRSTLYPSEWAPGFTDDEGRGLHDFSYAGYHNGEVPLGAMGPTEIVNVVDDFGADPTGVADATDAIQGAINDASAREHGAVVYLPEGLYRVDDVLTVFASRVVLRGAGHDRTRVYFTKSTGMTARAHVHFAWAPSHDLDLPLVSDGRSHEAVVVVEDAGDLAAGDDVAVGWVVTDDFVAEHGMTGTWVTFNGTWQTFFRRTVVAVDRTITPHRVTLDVPLRYRARVRDGASLRREDGYLSEVGVESLALSNAASLHDAWATSGTHVLRFEGVKDGWVSGVASFSSPNAPPTAGPGAHLMSKGVGVLLSKRVTVADTSMEHAQNRGPGGNGYLFEVSQSSEVLFRDLFATFGRHNFLQNWGFGTSGMVWLRVTSRDSLQEVSEEFAGLGVRCYSDFHHSLAIANLLDSSVFDDGFRVVNRRDYSMGAGVTGTESVLWNLRGQGTVSSMQYGMGYVIGTTELRVNTTSTLPEFDGTAPEDFTEGLGDGASLDPPSLYEDQLRRRLEASL